MIFLLTLLKIQHNSSSLQRKSNCDEHLLSPLLQSIDFSFNELQVMSSVLNEKRTEPIIHLEKPSKKRAIMETTKNNRNKKQKKRHIVEYNDKRPASTTLPEKKITKTKELCILQSNKFSCVSTSSNHLLTANNATKDNAFPKFSVLENFNLKNNKFCILLVDLLYTLIKSRSSILWLHKEFGKMMSICSKNTSYECVPVNKILQLKQSYFIESSAHLKENFILPIRLLKTFLDLELNHVELYVYANYDVLLSKLWLEKGFLSKKILSFNCLSSNQSIRSMRKNALFFYNNQLKMIYKFFQKENVDRSMLSFNNTRYSNTIFNFYPNDFSHFRRQCIIRDILPSLYDLVFYIEKNLKNNFLVLFKKSIFFLKFSFPSLNDCETKFNEKNYLVYWVFSYFIEFPINDFLYKTGKLKEKALNYKINGQSFVLKITIVVFCVIQNTEEALEYLNNEILMFYWAKTILFHMKNDEQQRFINFSNTVNYIFNKIPDLSIQQKSQELKNLKIDEASTKLSATAIFGQKKIIFNLVYSLYVITEKSLVEVLNK